MLNPHLREGAAARQASARDFPFGEPSHIHIARPSRLNRANLNQASLSQPASEVEPPAVVQLDLAVDQAA